MKVDVKQLSNGTRYFKSASGSTMHECHYCGTWFEPKRRFIQKYCSESCRVMACKKRKQGLYGTTGGNLNDRNPITNESLFNKMTDIQRELIETKKYNEELTLKLEHLEKGQKASFDVQNKIKEYTDYTLLASLILPLFGDDIKHFVSGIFNGGNENPKNFNAFKSKIKPFTDKIPEDLQKQVMGIAETYYNSDLNKEDRKNKSDLKGFV